MRRMGFGAAVLLCTLVLSHAAAADRDGSWAGVEHRANAAAGSVALPAPRFSSTAWIGAGENPFRMVAADLNGDGKADLAVVDISAATVSVRFGDGTGQFGPRTAYRTARRPLGLVASDLNVDGILDLASASTSATESITVFINRGTGQFSRAGAYAAGRDACGIAAADVNGDGIVDLLSAHARRKHFTVLLGQGAGAFGVAHRYRGGRACDIAAVDLNGDGKLDVVIADSDQRAVTVRLGGGDGTFGAPVAYASGSTPFGVAVADLKHDGRLDIATANPYPDASVSVLLGATDGSFGPQIRYPMGDEFEDYVDTVLVADYDRDGHLDIATPGRPSVRRGRGDGTFERRQRAFGGFAYTQAGAVADFNGDGWPDLAFSEACQEFEVDCDRYPARSIAVMLNWTGQPVPPCVVPPLVGQSPAYDAAELARAGCRVGHVSRRYSRRGFKGTVIAQRPRPGAVRPNNSPVNLIVSRGRRH